MKCQLWYLDVYEIVSADNDLKFCKISGFLKTFLRIPIKPKRTICMGRGWWELKQGRTATPLITSTVFSQSASRKHFSVALSCLHHISLQNQIADNFVSTGTKQRFKYKKLFFLSVCKCEKQVECTVPQIYCVWGILVTFFVDLKAKCCWLFCLLSKWIWYKSGRHGENWDYTSHFSPWVSHFST